MKTCSNVLLTVVVLGLMAAACGGPPMTGAPDVSGLEADEAQATLNAWSSIQLTAQAGIVQATSQSVSATDTAVRTTAEAQYAATAEVQAAWDALALETEAGRVRQTVTAGDAVAAAQATEVIRSVNGTSTAEADIQAYMRREADVAMREREAEAARSEMVNDLLPFIIVTAFLLLVAVIAAAVGAYMLIQVRRSKPQQVGEIGFTVWGPEGPLAITAPAARHSLPANVITQPAESEPESAADGRPQSAAWEDFIRWHSPIRAPLGRATEGPILLDARVSPHLFIAGSTRSGKTSGGLVPYVTWALTAQYNVMLLGERAADFSAFDEHPNAVNLRAYSDKARIELTSEALSAAREEMERRDQVLRRAKLNSWPDLLRRNPDEAGNLLIVIDEFLALATMGGTAVYRAMMQDVVSLTSQAGKFGIGLALVATDPRHDALGKMGYLAVKQCRRMAFRFNDRGSSQSVLGDAAAFNLPQGVFIYEDVAGGRRRGAAFHPSAAQVQAFLNSQRVETRALPDALLAVAAHSDLIVAEDETGDEIIEVWGGDLDGDGDSDAVILPAPRYAEPDNLSAADKLRLVAGYQRYGNLAAAQREVFGYDGGKAFYAAKSVLSEAGVLPE